MSRINDLLKHLLEMLKVDEQARLSIEGDKKKIILAPWNKHQLLIMRKCLYVAIDSAPNTNIKLEIARVGVMVDKLLQAIEEEGKK